MMLSSAEQIETYTARGWWGKQRLGGLFLANARATPAALALLDPANRADLVGDAPARYTYAELEQSVERLAARLLAAGIAKGDIVLVQLPNVAELVCVYLAAERIGAIVSPVPVQYRAHEVRQIMALTQPKACIVVSQFAGFNHLAMLQALAAELATAPVIVALGPNVPATVSALREWLSEPVAAEALRAYVAATALDANDIFTLCWTSGTEAEPKGVPRSHNHWLCIAYTTVDGAGLQPGDVLLNPFPLVNMSGIGGMLVPWLMTGGTLVMHHPLNLALFLQQIKAERVNYTVAPPVLLNMLLLNPSLLAATDLSSMRCIGSGSAPLSAQMVTQWKEKYGLDVLNFFGSNEGTAFVSSPHEVPEPSERARLFPRYGAGEFVWSNRAARGMQTKLVEPLTRRLLTERDEAGELAIKGPTIFAGYYRRPDLTAKAFDADGYFYTGDLFALDGAAGELDRYRFVGRLKDLIIRGGMKISPEELENLIAAHPSVAEVAVVGYMNPRLNDEHVCAVVVPKKDAAVDLHAIVEFLKSSDIAAYKLPRKLLIVASLPRNALGKVLKAQLRELLRRQAQSDDGSLPNAEPAPAAGQGGA